MADNKPSEKLPTAAKPTALTCGKGTAEQHQVAVSGDVSSGDTNSQAGVPNLSLTRLVLLGACVHLANFSVGFSFNAIAITLDDAAKELEIIDRDLQWYFNSFFLALVSCLTRSTLLQALRTGADFNVCSHVRTL